ncbi:MAG: DUF2378 family protein [Archangiaceae bacterium]|nr:DUF2378 family protein [Archangiaceae bacterium]
MSERLWFQQAIEGLFVRGVGEAMTPTLRARLVALGIDTAALRPGYDADVVTRAIRLTAAELFPGRSEGEALREMGALFMRGYVETLLGKAMIQLMRVVGPRRSLERMQRNFRTGSNYIETRFTSLGQGKVELWFNDVSDIPDYFAGVMIAGDQMANAPNIRVSFTRGGAASCTFLVEWDE